MNHKLWNLLCKLNKELLVLHSYLTDSSARRLLSEDECPETKSTFQQNENLSLLNKIIYGHNFWPIYFESRLFRMNILRTSRQLQSLRTYQSIAGKSLGEFKARFWIYRGLLGRCIILETIQNFNKPLESKTDAPGITITYFQPKTNITVNRENIYMGAKRTNDIPNYGAQVEFIIKDLVWLVFILIVVILVTCNFRGMSLTVLLENSSIKNLWVPIQFYSKSGHEPYRITGKLIQNKAFSRKIMFHEFRKYGWSCPEIGPAHAPEIEIS